MLVKLLLFETDEDGGYHNMLCYMLDSKLLWSIR